MNGVTSVCPREMHMTLIECDVVTTKYTFTGAFYSNSWVYIARVSVKLRIYTIPTQGGKDDNGKQFLSSLGVDKSSV